MLNAPNLTALLLLTLFPEIAMSSATDDIDWHLNSDDGTMTLAIKSEQPLEKVLSTLAAEMHFELELGQAHYPPVSGEYSGPAQIVLNKLARPASIIVSAQDQPPYQLQRVILLPTGDEDSPFLNSGAASSTLNNLNGPNQSPAKIRAMEKRLNRGL